MIYILCVTNKHLKHELVHQFYSLKSLNITPIIVGNNGYSPNYNNLEQITLYSTTELPITTIRKRALNYLSDKYKPKDDDYVWFVDSDDALVFNHLSDLEMITNCEKPDVIYCNKYLVDKTLNQTIEEQYIDIGIPKIYPMGKCPTYIWQLIFKAKYMSLFTDYGVNVFDEQPLLFNLTQLEGISWYIINKFPLVKYTKISGSGSLSNKVGKKYEEYYLRPIKLMEFLPQPVKDNMTSWAMRRINNGH